MTASLSRYRSAWVFFPLLALLPWLASCASSPSSRYDFVPTKPSSPVAGPAITMTSAEYEEAMSRVNAALQHGGDWQSAMPPVTRGWRTYCWHVVDRRTGRSGYEWRDYIITTGWVPSMDNDSPKNLRSLAVDIRQSNESIRLLPWYPDRAARDVGPYRVRPLTPREVRELSHYIEITQVDELKENRKPNQPLQRTPDTAPTVSAESDPRRR